MTDLAPVEAYTKTPVFARSRMGLFMALVFGSFMALGFGLILAFGDAEARRDVWKEAAAVLVSCAAAGFLFPFLLDLRVRRLAVRVYEGEGRYAAPPPSDEFTHRLLCNLMRSRSIAVGGALYVGPARVVFVPHAMNLPKDRQPVEIPREPLTVSLQPPQLTPFQRLLVPLAPEQLVLNSGGSSWRLVVPTPERVRDALAAALRNRR